ncbi:MAG: glycosyltransferase family 2 protein [Planctomycetes bacterium]|nr:glycosyltransferase family 2 protein [Planctomycetota bacterium]
MYHKLSILVPVYNEAATVETLLRRVAQVKFPIDCEIIVVNDGSTDGSDAVLNRLADEGLIQFVNQATNRGKGAAIRAATRRAGGTVLVVQDADLELDPSDLPSLLAPIIAGETKVCYGTRFAPPVPAYLRRLPTYWANRFLNAISNFLNGIRITDFNTCYKMMTAEVMAKLAITQNGFAMEPEITAKIARLGYHITEKPVHYLPRTVAGGKKIRALDFLKYLAAMVRYRFFWWPQPERMAKRPVLRPAGAAPAG